jgi:hypothetical protein
VEFIFPNETFPIVSAYADLGSKINISVDTMSETFSLTGNVDLRGGDVYYINRSFYIREGTVYFDETEIDFNPLITAQADITEISSDGPVTISLILENAPVLSFTPRFVSNPTLSQLEIMTLLGQASPSETTDPLLFLSISTDFLSQFTIVQNLQRRARNFLHLDMLSFRTQILQNALFLMTGIQTPDTNSGNFGNFFNNTSVYIGKYITQDMFLQAMGSIGSDETSEELGVTFGVDLGLEFNSPLADIKVNFNPMDLKNMKIDDLSFTLGWKWTF